MSIGQTFPDVLHLGDDLFRIITEDGFSWVHNHTNIGTQDIPRDLRIRGDSVVEDMIEDGIRVRRAAHLG